jgi:predicted nucleic acid-binding protein
MKSVFVLDAGAITLHFAGEPRLREYLQKVDRNEADGLMTEVNLSEYYYKTCRKLGKETADTRYLMLRTSRIRTVHDEALTREAGLEKCRQPFDLSLADCYALALVKREGGILLTTDSELHKIKEIRSRFFES